MMHIRAYARGHRALVVVAALAVGIGAFALAASLYGRNVIRIDEKKLYAVAYVVDGDTFAADIDGHVVTVRMLGIDTPEAVDPRKPVQCYGPEASAETKLLLEGRSVRLVANPNREARDKYGRYLMYAYRDDGLFVNEHLLDGGWAREYTYGTRYVLQDRFREKEDEAKHLKRGLWGACALPDKATSYHK